MSSTTVRSCGSTPGAGGTKAVMVPVWSTTNIRSSPATPFAEARERTNTGAGKSPATHSRSRETSAKAARGPVVVVVVVGVVVVVVGGGVPVVGAIVVVVVVVAPVAVVAVVPIEVPEQAAASSAKQATRVRR